MAKDGLTAKDIYDELWEGRNFELDHLWQRSVFVVSLLIVLVPAFFGLLNSSGWFEEAPYFVLFRLGHQDETVFDIERLLIGMLLLTLASAITAVSFYYIAMAKGSKYWYESYENGICAMYDEWYDELVSPEVRKVEYANIANRILSKGRGSLNMPHHGNMTGPYTRNCIYSLDAGDYSVSRVNIALGILLSIVGLMLLFISMAYMLSDFICSFLIAAGVYVLMLFLIPSTVMTHKCGWRHSALNSIKFKGTAERKLQDKNQAEWLNNLLQTYPDLIKKLLDAKLLKEKDCVSTTNKESTWNSKLKDEASTVDYHKFIKRVYSDDWNKDQFELILSCFLAEQYNKKIGEELSKYASFELGISLSEYLSKCEKYESDCSWECKEEIGIRKGEPCISLNIPWKDIRNGENPVVYHGFRYAFCRTANKQLLSEVVFISDYVGLDSISSDYYRSDGCKISFNWYKTVK